MADGAGSDASEPLGSTPQEAVRRKTKRSGSSPSIAQVDGLRSPEYHPSNPQATCLDAPQTAYTSRWRRLCSAWAGSFQAGGRSSARRRRAMNDAFFQAKTSRASIPADHCGERGVHAFRVAMDGQRLGDDAPFDLTDDERARVVVIADKLGAS